MTIKQVLDHTGPPLILFLGINTAGSLVHQTFPHWAAGLDKPWLLRGIDLPPEAGSDSYRDLITAIRRNPHISGMVITSHKLRIFDAAHDLLSPHRDPINDITREVNCLATAGHRQPHAYARDPLALSPILDQLPGGRPQHHVLCLGAGGAATALLLALTVNIPIATATGQLRPHSNPPAHLAFADIDPTALHNLQEVAGHCPTTPTEITYHPLASTTDVAHLAENLPAQSLIINATGLGKDKPGTPLPSDTRFPDHALAWDLNYRGDLTFLHQARSQGVPTIDGWDYFLAGWCAALTTIAGRSFTNGLLNAFAETARPLRPGN